MLSQSHHRENQHNVRHSINKLNTRSLSLATAIITGLVYILCILFVAIAPKAAMAFFSYVLHMDLTNIARVITWGSFIVGLLFWTVGTALYAALIARLYNSFATR
ncbi:hypothetical protein NIES37_71710 (plasmid) [Tolypothrix tenuis PCC 7101]|uniref:Uncharacterized protein n=2 Tax=Nostocales TaxID=1161 RepID=A0A1Z4NBQ2_9CYAN|nr:DUF5676 family membrane protein [Nostoc spongiaeforme]MBD2236275.1 hypothetical protein [Aulosira sp. FACHB-113]MBD2597469.1 hypothetical protein [Nostoc spongiaeforme FACHB-130]BAZ03158.1 hypothetical protein NIES37_71710 [Tolypothrix tenuis PCC 7101]BAZ78569.1 hypothetical protein NIES50_72020 [Aulosira laxa NIES-50]